MSLSNRGGFDFVSDVHTFRSSQGENVELYLKTVSFFYNICYKYHKASVKASKKSQKIATNMKMEGWVEMRA